MSGDPRFDHVQTDALTRLERRVAELWDMGLTIEAIAAATGRSRDRIAKYVEMIENFDDGEDRHASVRGSCLLVAAIRQFHPHIAVRALVDGVTSEGVPEDSAEGGVL